MEFQSVMLFSSNADNKILIYIPKAWINQKKNTINKILHFLNKKNEYIKFTKKKK